MSEFTCHNLLPGEAATLFPLMREAVPGIDLKTWLRFARRISRQKRAAQCGIMVVQRRGRSMPCGMFVYHCEDDLAHGPTLVAEHIIAVDMLDPAPVTRALIAELDRLAKQLGCAAVRAMVLGKTSLVAACLGEAGHRPEGAALSKQLVGGSPHPRYATPIC